MKLEIKGLTKRFGSFTANDQIDLTIEPGEIHCLLGENGAGKSTLMNMLYGLLDPTEGEILVDGEPVRSSPRPATRSHAGIGMVHQHFMLVPVFTVAENVMLGREQTRALGVLTGRKAAEHGARALRALRPPVDPDALVEDLPVGVQQRVEILKALSNDAKVLILDEPTAVLTPQEIDELMDIMRSLKEQGTSIIFITHKLREVKAVGDRISVIRRGKVVGTAPPTASEAELAEMMVGREVKLTVDKARAPGRRRGPRRRNVTVVDPRGHQVVKDVSFEARAGEVLGIAGVQGNGQTELIKSLLGTGEARRRRDPPRRPRHQQARSAREPRRRDRLHPRGPLPRRLRRCVQRSGRISSSTSTAATSSRRARAQARRDREERRRADQAVRHPHRVGVLDPVSSLSGGNQQKVVVAREFSRDLKVLIASQPTRGVDVGSIEFIHKRIVEERDQGTAVIIVSTELDEIFALSDRIAVMYDGRIVGTVSPDIAREDIGLMMAGAHEPAEGVTA